MVEQRGSGKGRNQPSVELMPNKGSVSYRQLVTEVKGGDVFIRRLKVVTYEYQRCQWVYQDGHRRLKILKTLARKPCLKRGGMRKPLIHIGKVST